MIQALKDIRSIRIVFFDHDLVHQAYAQHRHERAGYSVPGTVRNSNDYFVPDLCEPVKITADNVLGLEKDERFWEEAEEMLFFQHHSFLDTLCINDAVIQFVVFFFFEPDLFTETEADLCIFWLE